MKTLISKVSQYFCLFFSFLISCLPTQKGRRKCLVLNWAWNKKSLKTTRKASLLILLTNTRGRCSRNLAKFITQFCRLTCEVLSIWKETDKKLSIRFYLNRSQTLKFLRFNKGDIFIACTVLLPDSSCQRWTCEQSQLTPHTRQTYRTAEWSFLVAWWF